MHPCPIGVSGVRPQIQIRRSAAARQRGTETLLRLGAELRDARLQHGLTQARVGAAAGISRSRISRIERGLAPELSATSAIRLFCAVGLELSIRGYPGGQPVRDSAHLALIERLRAVVASAATWQVERPLPIPRDQRAWDITLGLAGGVAAVEAETRPRDVQSLLRRLSIKLRDDRTIDRLVLLLANTRHNRTLLRQYREEVVTGFPATPVDVRAALAQGRLPEANGVLLL